MHILEWVIQVLVVSNLQQASLMVSAAPKHHGNALTLHKVDPRHCNHCALSQTFAELHIGTTCTNAVIT